MIEEAKKKLFGALLNRSYGCCNFIDISYAKDKTSL
jgi:hypothetical protein